MVDKESHQHSLDKCPQEIRIKKIEEVNTETLVQLAILGNDVSYIKASVDKIDKQMNDKYLLKSEFEPIKRIVYGTTGLILVAVVMALISLVVRRG